MYRKQVRRRRAVLLLLVAASLTLLSLYYREGNAGPLHGAENVVSTIFSPISSVTDRALKPVRDTVNWFHETFDARGDKAQLQDQVASLRNQLAREQTQQGEAKELSALNELTSGGIVPDGTTPVTARVVGRSPTVWYSTVTIDKGSGDGVRVDDPVVAAQGLAGKITQTTPNTAQVTLITDARQRRDRTCAAERGDRRRRAQRRQSQRPAARLPRARLPDRRGADGRHGRVLDGQPGIDLPARNPDRQDHPCRRSRSSRPTSGCTSRRSPTCANMDFVKVLTTHSGGGSK